MILFRKNLTQKLISVRSLTLHLSTALQNLQISHGSKLRFSFNENIFFWVLVKHRMTMVFSKGTEMRC